jgi:hypothetical protein
LWREQRVAWVAPFLVAAGLTATTISNTVWLVLVLLSLGLFSGMRSETARRRMESLWSLGICPLLYIFAAMVGLLWVKLGVLLAHLGWSTWIRGLPRALKSLRPMLWVPAFLGIAIFCLIFGNIAAGNFLGTWLREMMAVFSVPPDLISLAPEKAKALLDPLMGDHRETELYSLYSLSPYTFILLYGGFLILAALALRVRTSLGDAEDLVFAALTFALPFVFFFVEFVGVGDRAWVRTRFLEVPVCLIVFYSVVLLFKSGERRNWVRAYLLAFTIIPFIATERPLQIWENFKLLLSLG